MPLLKIFFHDACFDGTASAAVFSRFYREVIDPSLPAGARVVVERGRAGVVAIVRTTRADGTTTARRVRYQPEDRVVRVAAGS